MTVLTVINACYYDSNNNFVSTKNTYRTSNYYNITVPYFVLFYSDILSHQLQIWKIHHFENKSN